MKFQKTLLMSVLALNLLSSSGCFAVVVGAAAGAGGVAWIRGVLVQNVDEDIKRTHDVTLDAVKKIGLMVASDQMDLHACTIKGSFADGKKFTVQLNSLTEHATKISIRVGTFGDEERSRMILNAITEKL